MNKNSGGLSGRPARGWNLRSEYLFAAAIVALAAVVSGCGGGGGGGGGGTTVCTTHSSRACDGSDVYWYDSCNKKEELYQACSEDETCSNAQCLTTLHTWSKTLGGAAGDTAEDIKQTADGGYIVAGDTKSSGGGLSDVYVIKLDTQGTQEWTRVFGGAGFDAAKSVVQTADGGYAAAGYTNSQGSGLADVWILKLTASGTQVWERVYGGSSSDAAESIIQTSDGGYAVAGYTYSLGMGLADIWVMKLDSSGIMQWQLVRGGTGNDVAREIRETADGGYIIAGFTTSTGYGQEDFYAVKLTSSGAVSWEKTYGGASIDKAESIIQAADGGYVIAGETASTGNGESDFWILKLGSTGTPAWTKIYGGVQFDASYSVAASPAGGYIVAGYTDSSGAGAEDMLLLKISAAGATEWYRTFGGAFADVAHAVIPTSDGGYAVAGYTASSGAGLEDVYLLKLNSSGQM